MGLSRFSGLAAFVSKDVSRVFVYLQLEDTEVISLSGAKGKFVYCPV